MEDLEEKYSAYHEAGHAIAAIKLGIELTNVYLEHKAIIRSGQLRNSSGRYEFVRPHSMDFRGKGIDCIRKYLIMFRAGLAAELEINPNATGKSAGLDLDQETEFVINALGSKDIEQSLKLYNEEFLPAIWEETCKLIKDNWKDVERLAIKLGQTKQVSRRQILKLINEDCNM